MINLEFLITSLVVVLVPGTGVIYTVSNGLFVGRRAGIAAAFGCTTGIIPHLTASILGLSAILHTSALMFQAVKYAGAVYLFYLAWCMWKDTGLIRLESPGKTSGLRKIVVRGFLINILNPKLSIFFLAFLPHFVVPGNGAPMFQFVSLSAVFMGMTLVVFILYGLLANYARRFIAGSPKMVQRMQRSFAAVFALLGARLAMARQ